MATPASPPPTTKISHSTVWLGVGDADKTDGIKDERKDRVIISDRFILDEYLNPTPSELLDVNIGKMYMPSTRYQLNDCG